MQKPESRLDFNISHLSEIFPLFALRFSERTDFETEQRVKCSDTKGDS